MINKEQVEQFISDYERLAIPDLALLLSKKPDFPSEYIINQIQGRRIAKSKLPDWNHPGITFPDKRAMEQCSSSITGEYKGRQVVKGKSVVDLTGGLGVDTYYLGKQFREVLYVEANPTLFKISKNNLSILLPDKDCVFVNGTAEDFLNTTQTTFDLIYLDPDRRISGMKKGVKIEDCSPNVIDIEEQLLKKGKEILVKFSPLLDIKQALYQVKSIYKVTVISVNNDCKEVLLSLSKTKNTKVLISCINITNSGEEHFDFTFEKEENTQSDFSDPLKYVYEPNASILKAGGFKIIGAHYGLKKLAINSHFYTSNEKVTNFPGRVFEVVKVTNQIKELAKKANIISRNHPLTPEEIKKKGKLKDGGLDYILATRLHNNKPSYLLCKRES